MIKCLWRFCYNYGFVGVVDGLFVATEDEVRNAIGKDFDFGSILGKHSDVYGTLRETDLYKVMVSQEAIEEISSELGRNWSGHNPLDYIQHDCVECGLSYTVEEFSIESGKCVYCKEEVGN